MLSVKELRPLIRSLGPKEFKAQVGPFALIQRLPEDLSRQYAQELGAQATVVTKRKTGSDNQALLKEFDDLMVATLPPMRESDELSVGRLPDCELVIDDPSVSKRHAKLRWDGNKRCVLTDLGSTNGTLVNGSAVWEAETVLKDGDVIDFGNVPFCYFVTETLFSLLTRIPPASAGGNRAERA